ncbi:MAG: hypothetical protein FWC10_11000 [Lentimicrobiaceae bacterium]|nr:hypothetical protein [Lentimicrobiaceae bacterium]
MSEAKKALLFCLIMKPWWSIRGAKRFLSICLDGNIGKQINQVALSQAEIPKAKKNQKALLPNAEIQNRILQAITAVNSACTSDNEKLQAIATIF